MSGINAHVRSPLEDRFGSVDLGYGHIKGKRGDVEFTFPSVVGPERELLQSDLLKKQPLLHLRDLKRGLFVGDLALRQSVTKNFSLKEERMDHPQTRSLLETSLGLMMANTNLNRLNLVTGLPVSYYFEQKQRMEEVIVGEHDINIMAGEHEINRKIVVEEMKLLPQALGSAFNFLLDQQGKIVEERRNYAKGLIGVLDIGFFTNDLLVLNQLEVIKDFSKSLRSGISLAYRAMADVGIDLPLYEIDKKVREGHFVGAKERAYQALADQITGEIETYWPQLDLIIVSGGGGRELFNYFTFPSSVDIVLAGQMDNVMGYNKIGRRTWG